MQTIEIQMEDDEYLIPFRVKISDLPDIIATHCEIGGYSAQIFVEGQAELIDNPITPAQFAWRRVRDFAINPVIQADLESKKEQKLAEITPREIIVKGS